MTSSGRVLALDIGSVRVGAAVSDFNRIIAQGLGVWNFETWREEFDASLKKYDPAIIVIGLLMTVLCSTAFAHHYICEFCGYGVDASNMPQPGNSCQKNPSGKFHMWLQND